MADDKTKRGPADSSKISMSEDYEVQYWTKKLSCTKEQLAAAMKKVGNSAEAVAEELG